MPCESCAVQFSILKRKRACVECERYYCSGCLRRGGGSMCAPCRVLSARPFTRHTLAHLRVRDLQYFLQRQNVSTRGCVEKDDLVNLILVHGNNGIPRRRGPPPRPSSDFTQTFSSSIKGLTSNINSFINNAFDIRAQPARAPPQPPPNCYNSGHSHRSDGATASGVSSRQTSAQHPLSEPRTAAHTNRRRSTPPPSSSPPRVPQVNISSPDEDTDETTESVHRDTADCLEIEDLDDTAEWEFVNRPADPLPNDSNVLIADYSNDTPPGTSLNLRAVSELDLRRSESAEAATDSSSLQDEPFMHSEPSLPKRIRLQDLKTLSDLEDLNVKQLKELLALNRVDFKGCVERAELLERAKRLWRETPKSKEELNTLSLEDSCKICMDAPLECVLLECGHIAACTACSKRLSECPICRQYVVRVVRVFRT